MTSVPLGLALVGGSVACVGELIGQAHAKGADKLIALQLVQSQYQWNARTSVVATAVRRVG